MNGQLTLEGTVLIIVPSSGEVFAIADAGSAWCDDCSVLAPLLTDGGGEWGTACCYFVCEHCGDLESRADQQQCEACYSCCSHHACGGCLVCCDDWCTRCECCEECCECQHCDGCGVAVETTCGDCYCCEGCCSCYSSCCDCGECSGCGDEDCSTCNRGRGPASVPGWEQRGDRTGVVAVEPLSTFTEPARPVEMMADFYLSEWCAVVSRDRAIARDAAVMQSAIVAACDGAFREYVFSAIGGELRHHRNVSLGGGRSSAWDYWRGMAECGDRVALIRDAVALFEDGSWTAGYGGEAWATCARVLLSRETGALDPRTFVDRVFSLQHNSGSLLDKVEWNEDESTYYMRVIGNAHDARTTGLSTLYRYASEDGRALLLRTDWEQHTSEQQRLDMRYMLEDCEAYGRRARGTWTAETWIHPHNTRSVDTYGAAIADMARAVESATYCADMVRSGAAWWQQYEDESAWSYNARLALAWEQRCA